MALLYIPCQCYKFDMILDTFPCPEDFYKTYWGKKPFIVKNFIAKHIIETLIDGDTLAGLSLEEDIRSRFITNDKNGMNWACEQGPFPDTHFDNLSDQNWSLLVQNVEHHHKDTAKLLKHFQFSPRWLLDDVMVSFSAPGGSVGPHTDSYHTFLVQGIGKRTWKISPERIEEEDYADNPDMKILKNGFEGDTFEVTAGDVIYMPPFFGHEGKTLEAAMTFSVGFLGPQLSEMLADYAQYLEENDSLNKRYLAETLDIESSGFSISESTQDTIKHDLLSAIQSEAFGVWMATYFAQTTHEDIDDVETNNTQLSTIEILTALECGKVLSRPEETKIAITVASDGGFHVSAYDVVTYVPETLYPLIKVLNLGGPISLNTVQELENLEAALKLIAHLYCNNILTLCTDDE